MFTPSATSQTNTPLPSLIAGDFPRVTRKVTIASGAGLLIAGTLLGRITASKKMVKSASASSDGSQTPNAVLAETVDATAADAEAIVYFTGEFNADQLTLGTGHTADSVRDGLRDLSIFL
ncbi:head decoration protein [Azospirillum doebereinerae]|uniref:Head decoration protein n=1 Tax=Azospirillum doebereinerae TaxID=92933 RepID=A0A3S1CDP6_9PROT|nr:head decoration protein [Azospirillum doebereinerae]RUQ63989.1 head decoration protein [Azospirillum doebereinerae]